MPNQKATNSLGREYTQCATPGCGTIASVKYVNKSGRLCVHCARKAGLAPPAPRGPRKSKAAVEDQDQKSKIEGTGVIDSDILDAVSPLDYDLEATYAVYKELSGGADENKTNYDKRFAYMEWCFSNRPTRKPKTKIECAEILGVSVGILQYWEKQPSFRKLHTKMLTERITTGLPYQSYVIAVLTGVKNGDNRSVVAYQKILEKFGDVTDQKGETKAEAPGTAEQHEKLKEKIRAKEEATGVKELQLRGAAKAAQENDLAEGIEDDRVDA